MSTHHPPRHCFVTAFWYSSSNKLVCGFTEGEIYRFAEVNAALWGELKSDAMSGETFNHAWRPPNRSTREYERLAAVPPGFTDFWSR